MIDTLLKFKEELFKALYQTLDMLLWASLLSIIFGTLLGLLLFLTSKDELFENKILYSVLSVVTNIIRAIPFILFIIIIIPFNRFLIGTGFGPNASKIPLTIIGIANLGKLVETSFLSADKHLFETSYHLGATKFGYIKNFLIKESRHNLVANFKTNTISILAYSTVVGTIGGGGLGYLAISEGFSNFNYNLMWIIITMMILLVVVIDGSLNIVVKKLDKR